jgi:hypothetical protein
MKKREYLENSIEEGLMLTGHMVDFKFSSLPADWQKLLQDIIPLVNRRLAELGTTLQSLPEDRKKIIFIGIGSITGEVPMLCFSEVTSGKNISDNKQMFGHYGLVLTRDWVENNGGDKVIYIGNGTTISKHIAYALASLRSLSLFLDNRSNNVVFENYTEKMVLNLFCFIENRININETEWRIAGNPGFMGGKNENGKKYAFPMGDIKYVFVRKKDEIKPISQLLRSKAQKECFSGELPAIIEFPEAMP